VRVETGGLGRPGLAPAVETALYRIMQEALSNVARHAGARHVRVQLDRSAPWSRWSSATTASASIPTPAGAGHRGPRPRHPHHARAAAVLNGTLTHRSAPGRGTRVSVEIPVARDAVT
jgi:signal transduction histidine kinase